MKATVTRAGRRSGKSSTTIGKRCLLSRISKWQMQDRPKEEKTAWGCWALMHWRKKHLVSYGLLVLYGRAAGSLAFPAKIRIGKACKPISFSSRREWLGRGLPKKGAFVCNRSSQGWAPDRRLLRYESFAGAVSRSGHLYLETLWKLDDDGTDSMHQFRSRGIVLRPDDYHFIELLRASEEQTNERS